MKKLLTWLFLVWCFLLCSLSVEAATIYIDGTLTDDCIDGTYSVLNRTCGSGKDGNAYNDIAAALSASGTNDTINIRAGSYTSNVSDSNGIVVSNGQTWQTYPGDMPNRATITASGASNFIFRCFTGTSNVTIKDLILRGGAATQYGIYLVGITTALVQNLDIADFDLNNCDFCHGITVSGPSSTGVTIRQNNVHDPGQTSATNIGGIVTTSGDSSALIELNTVNNVPVGIWSDVDSGNPDLCDAGQSCTTRDPHTIQNNTISNADYCIQIEARSAAHYYHNVLYDCVHFGFSARPGGTMRDIVFQQNTIYNAGWVGIFLENEESPVSHYYDIHIGSNIVHTSSIDFASMIFGAPASDATNSVNNNLIYTTTAPLSVCWNNPTTGMGVYCSGGTFYDPDLTGVELFNSEVSVAVGNTFGDPLFGVPKQ